MYVKNLRPYPVEIAHPDFFATVDEGDTIEVPGDVGASLVEQVDNWQAVEDAGQSTVADVLAEVDGDPVRARRALAVENDSGKPRKTLVSQLGEIIATDEENS